MRWIRKKHRDRWRLPVVNTPTPESKITTTEAPFDVEAQMGDDREKRTTERIEAFKGIARSYRETFAAMTSRPPYWSDPLGEWVYFPAEIGAQRSGLSEHDYLCGLQLHLDEGTVCAHPFLEDYYSEKVSELYLDSVFSVHKTGLPQIWHDRT